MLQCIYILRMITFMIKRKASDLDYSNPKQDTYKKLKLEVQHNNQDNNELVSQINIIYSSDKKREQKLKDVVNLVNQTTKDVTNLANKTTNICNDFNVITHNIPNDKSHYDSYNIVKGYSTYIDQIANTVTDILFAAENIFPLFDALNQHLINLHTLSQRFFHNFDTSHYEIADFVEALERHDIGYHLVQLKCFILDVVNFSNIYLKNITELDVCDVRTINNTIWNEHINNKNSYSLFGSSDEADQLYLRGICKDESMIPQIIEAFHEKQQQVVNNNSNTDSEHHEFIPSILEGHVIHAICAILQEPLKGEDEDDDNIDCINLNIKHCRTVAKYLVDLSCKYTHLHINNSFSLDTEIQDMFQKLQKQGATTTEKNLFNDSYFFYNVLQRQNTDDSFNNMLQQNNDINTQDSILPPFSSTIDSYSSIEETVLYDVYLL